MKHLTLSLTLIVLCFSCNFNKKNNEKQAETSDTIINDNSKIWAIGNDTLQIFYETAEDFGKDAVQNLKVFFNKKLILKDSAVYNINEAKFLKVENTDYLLIAQLGFFMNDEWLIFEIKNSAVKIHTNIIKEIFADIDNDGIIEVGGCGTKEAICLDCDSTFYSPYRIYKLGNSVSFDSLLSQNLTKKEYGTFLGYEYKDTIIVVTK